MSPRLLSSYPGEDPVQQTPQCPSYPAISMRNCQRDVFGALTLLKVRHGGAAWRRETGCSAPRSDCDGVQGIFRCKNISGTFDGSFWDVKTGMIGMLRSLSTEEAELPCEDYLCFYRSKYIDTSRQCCYRRTSADPLADVQMCPPAMSKCVLPRQGSQYRG